MALGFAAQSRAQTCVKYPDNQGCQPPLHPQQCFPVAGGPSFWQDVGGDRTWQYRRAIQDPSDQVCEGTLGNDIPNCCGGLPPASSTPTVSLHVVGKRILVDYNAPGLYCTNVGDWPPSYTCTNDPEGATDRVSLFDGVGNVIRRAYIYFEDGTWDTGIDIPNCGQTASYQASIKYLTGGGLVTAFSAITALTATCSSDRQVCPAGTSVAQPINVGSGDVMVRQPLFTIAQEPMSLPFTLTYHSEAALFPALVSSPVGLGWTHDYAQTLRPEDGTNNRLYRITPEGYEDEYLRIAPDTTWIAINPSELRGTITQVGSEYQLTDLNGTVTSFDVATGHWNSTKDRWGNTISGTYTNGQLTTITDSMGRQIQLSYGNPVTITLAGGNTWKLFLTGNLLTAIRDPLHSSTDWHTYTYVNDHAGVQRLLSSIKDDASQELEAHTYDNISGTGTDRALTSSQAGSTRSNVSISYNDAASTRTVTHTIDGSTNETTTFNVAYLGGRWLPTQITGNCTTCGGSDADLQIFTYDYSNHAIDKKDGSGGEQVETQYTYDGNGMPLSKIEAVGRTEQRTTSYAYSYVPPTGTPAWPAFLTQVTEQSPANPGQSKTTTYTWNSSGAPETTLTVVTTGYLPGPPPTQVTYTTTSTYDSPRHRLTAVTGPATNQKVTHAYNADAATNDGGRRNKTSVYTSATVHLDTQFASYDLYGTPGTVTDPNGVQTSTATDGRGRVTTVTSLHVTGDPNETLDYTTTYAFDTRDRLTKVTLPLLNQIQYGYEDGTNRLTDTIRADSTTNHNQQERLHLTLNVIGDKVQEDAQSCNSPAASCAAWTTKRTDSFSYDAHNRLSSITHFDGTHIDYTYDSRGNLTTVKDERHTAANTIYAYDFLNRLKTVTQKQTIVPGPDVITQYGYDVQDNLSSVTDPNGNVTTYAYDDFRRLQTQTSPVSGTTSYSYDPAGNLLTSTDANAALTTRVYDAANRATSATSTRSGFTTETVTWTYDDATVGKYGKGRLATMTDPSGSATYAYERRGLLRSEAKTVGGTVFTSSYGYDKNGNRKTVTYPSTRSVSYTFDYADRPLTAIRGATTYVSAAAYAPFGPETQTAYGNGTTRTVTLDQRYRVTENKLVKGATTLADYVYAEDSVGSITQIHDAVNATYNRDFSYDDLNRLTTANSGTSLWGTATGNGYAYDKMGNVTSITLGTSRTATFTYSGTLPKLTSVTETGFGTRSVSYDLAGNESMVGTGTFVYTSRNYLKNAGGLLHSYDGRGLRTIVVVTSPTKNLRYFFYSPEMNLLEETSLAANPSALSGYDHIWFNGHPVAEEDGGIHWTFTDHLGTPILQTDSTGTGIFWRAEYEPYGKVFSLRTTNQHEPLRLPGQEAEELNVSSDGNGSSERFYNIFRWYRSRWGRYTQADPMRLTAGRHRAPIVDPNLFAYVLDSPSGYADPLGLCRLNMLEPRIRYIHPSQLLLYCPANSYACTKFAGAQLECPCVCAGSDWRMEPAAQVIPFMYLTKPSDRAHEQKHVNYVASAACTYLDELEARRFRTQTECDNACLAEQLAFPDLIRAIAADSQSLLH